MAVQVIVPGAKAVRWQNSTRTIDLIFIADSFDYFKVLHKKMLAGSLGIRLKNQFVINQGLRHIYLIFGQNVAMAKSIKTGLKKAGTRAKRNQPEAVSGVKEPAVHYNILRESGSPNKGKKVLLTYWLGIAHGNVKPVATEFDIIKLGTSGITKNAINTLASFIGISRKYISENIFDVSVKTMERKDNKEKLDKKTSSHAVEIARILQHGYEVFRDEEKLKRWLNKENRALNNLKPVEMFDTLSGLIFVNDILGRIEEGVYS